MARRSSTSAVVGIAVEHSSREATIAPATLANSRMRSQLPAGEQAVAQGAAEGVAGAEAVDDVDRERAAPRRARRAVAASTPLRALLDDGELDAALEQRVGGPLRVGLADRDLALLAVADGDGHVLEGPADLLRVASAGSAQNIGR